MLIISARISLTNMETLLTAMRKGEGPRQLIRFISPIDWKVHMNIIGLSVCAHLIVLLYSAYPQTEIVL